MLIENGADVNVFETHTLIYLRFYTPLHFVFMNVHSPTREIVELLIERGANVNAVFPGDQLGDSPFDYALCMESGKCTSLFNSFERNQLVCIYKTCLKFKNLKFLTRNCLTKSQGVV